MEHSALTPAGLPVRSRLLDLNDADKLWEAGFDAGVVKTLAINPHNKRAERKRWAAGFDAGRRFAKLFLNATRQS